MKRRDFIKSTAVILANAALSRLALAAPAVHTKEVKIGIFTPSHCAAPLIYASIKDFYKKDAGLAVRLIRYPSQQDIAKDLVSGKIDMGQMIGPLVFAINAGANPMKLHAPMVSPMILGVHGSNLMVRKDAGISKPEDFKGKVIASHSKLSIHYLLTRLFLQKNGVDIEKDTKSSIVLLSELQSMAAQGKIDAFMMPEPQNALAENSGNVSTFVMNRYIWQYHPCCTLSTTKDSFNKDIGMMKALTGVVIKASLHINKEANRGELTDILWDTKSWGYNEIPKNVLKISMSSQRSDWQPFPYQSTAAMMLNMLVEYKLLPKTDVKAVSREVFLSSFASEVLQSVGVRPPQNDFRPEKIMGKLYDFSA